MHYSAFSILVIASRKYCRIAIVAFLDRAIVATSSRARQIGEAMVTIRGNDGLPGAAAAEILRQGRQGKAPPIKALACLPMSQWKTVEQFDRRLQDFRNLSDDLTGRIEGYLARGNGVTRDELDELRQSVSCLTSGARTFLDQARDRRFGTVQQQSEIRSIADGGPEWSAAIEALRLQSLGRDIRPPTEQDVLRPGFVEYQKSKANSAAIQANQFLDSRNRQPRTSEQQAKARDQLRFERNRLENANHAVSYYAKIASAAGERGRAEKLEENANALGALIKNLADLETELMARQYPPARR
jgi:hypothetical protein